MAIVKTDRSPYYKVRFKMTHQGVQRVIDESTKTTCRVEAKRYEAKRIQEVREELLYGVKAKHTWKEATSKWLIERSHKKSLIDDKRYINWLSSEFDSLTLDNITNEEIERVAKKKEAENVSNATVNRMLSLIKSILRASWKEWGWIDRVPYIRMRKEPVERVRWITKEEADRLLACLPKHLALAAEFALLTGLRDSNVRELTKSEVDFTNKMIHIPGHKMKSGRNFSRPICDRSVQILRACWDNHKDFLFTYEGEPITGQLGARAWRKALDRADIEDFRWHDLRHTFASWFVQGGGSLLKLMKLGDWTSYNSVLKYAHFAPEHLREAV